MLLVDCSMAQATADVVQSFASSPPPSLANKNATVRLVVMSSELPGLDDDSFGNVSFTHVHIKYNHGLDHVAPDAFSASRSTLRVLDLRNNNLTTFPLANLRSFEQLQFLSVDDNGVSEVPDRVSELASLVHLSASNNRLHTLHPSALTSLPLLQFLDLHSNHLDYLPHQLAFLPALRSLIVWGNPITTLSPGSFRGMRSLEYVDLSYTNIKEVGVSSMETPTSSPWFISFRRTPITKLSEAAFHNGSLPSWVDLRETGVQSLNQAFFQPLLHNMAQQNIVHNDWGKPQLWIHNEDLACDCSIKWLVTNTTLLHHVSGRCNDKNINVRFLDPDYFNIFCF
ncbi:leucine-rich repeat-containing G-protein coupled receptor 6 [Procambarus clarkii]|uniref:leucine-rich repeat-containing G-protein coupled receptor 6 n=1 Tax=Procambarus clarkii TaxID=6728 RepID=UPI0037440C20